MAPRVPRKKGQPAKSKKHSDLYTDEDPKGTITGLKFATVKDAEASVRKIKASDRTDAHKTQAAIAMEQRAKVAGKIAAAAVFRKFIESQKKKTMAKKKSKKMAVGGVAKKRNYRKEYDNYHANPTQIKRRTSRNAARGALMKAGVAKRGDGKDVAHKNGNPSDNRRGNLTLQRPSQNRSFARTKTAGKRNRRA
tara:strand:+ start:1214 stop:1795 length:582 start_codon:yes stop_codon:yes gene_type:complete